MSIFPNMTIGLIYGVDRVPDIEYRRFARDCNSRYCPKALMFREITKRININIDLMLFLINEIKIAHLNSKIRQFL